MFLSVIWDIDPEIFSIGSISVRYYGLLWATSFILSYYILKKIFLKEGLNVDMLDKLSTYVFIGTIVGARFGHIFFYGPYFDEFNAQGQLITTGYFSHPIEMLKIMNGGLASHGAGIGIMVALWYFTKKYDRTFLWLADRIAIAVALSGFLIRMGNLLNSEIYGVKTDLPWGFVFQRMGETIAKHPTQIYEGGIALIVFISLMYMYFKTKLFEKSGLAFGIFMAVIFLDRFFIEFIKEKQVDFEANMFLDMGQILSIPLILIGIFFIARALKTKKAA